MNAGASLKSMCFKGAEDPPPQEAPRPQTSHDRYLESARRPTAQTSSGTSRRPQSRREISTSSGQEKERARPSSSRQKRPPSTGSHSKRPSSSSHPPSRRPSTSHTQSRRPTSSQQRPRTAYQPRRGEFDTIMELQPVQYTQDQTILNKFAELRTLIDHHSDSFYAPSGNISNGNSDSELNNPDEGNANIRRLIAKTIIDNVILAHGERYNVDIQVPRLFILTEAKAQTYKISRSCYPPNWLGTHPMTTTVNVKITSMRSSSSARNCGAFGPPTPRLGHLALGMKELCLGADSLWCSLRCYKMMSRWPRDKFFDSDAENGSQFVSLLGSWNFWRQTVLYFYISLEEYRGVDKVGRPRIMR